MEYNANKYMTVTEALRMLEACGFRISRPTLMDWIRKNNLGMQPCGKGKFLIFRSKLEDFLNGKIKTAGKSR